jgi:hypothetical protein
MANENWFTYRDVLVIHGCNANFANGDGWQTAAILGRVTNDGQVANHVAGEQRILWALKLLRAVPVSFALGQSAAAADMIIAHLRSGLYGSVLLVEPDGTDKLVTHLLGDALKAYVHAGGALFVTSANASFQPPYIGGLCFLRSVFGVDWRPTSYNRETSVAAPHNVALLRRLFGSMVPHPVPDLPIENVSFYTKMIFLAGVRPEEQIIVVQDGSGNSADTPAWGLAAGSFPAPASASASPASERHVSLAVCTHGAGHVGYACFINPSNPLMGLAVCFARYAAAAEPDGAWSVHTHAQYPALARKRATALVLLGRRLGLAVLGSATRADQLRDVWLSAVLPKCISQDWLRVGCQVVVAGLTSESASQWNGRHARVVSFTPDGSRVAIEVLRERCVEPAPMGPASASPTPKGVRHGHLGVGLDLRVKPPTVAKLLCKPENLHVSF